MPVVRRAPSTQAGSDFTLHLSQDRMTLFIDFEFSPETIDTVTTRVLAELTRMGLGAEGYLARASLRLAEASTQGPTLTDYPLLEGKRPTPPREGGIVGTDTYFAKGFEVDPETGAPMTTGAPKAEGP